MRDRFETQGPTAGFSAESVVGPSVKIQGDLNSEGSVRVEGQVTGKIKTAQMFQSAEGSKITADISAGSAEIGGDVKGNIRVASGLVLLGSARLTGDVTCGTLRVEEGAVWSGRCTMGQPVAEANEPLE
jgi:cytoskeletal protein CcmA (bactofilin family)